MAPVRPNADVGPEQGWDRSGGGADVAGAAADGTVGLLEPMPTPRPITSTAEACTLLLELGAPPRLMRHAELVSEAAVALLALLAQHGVRPDAGWLLAGAALHDAGKVLHPAELAGPGAEHEPAGEALLLSHGVAPHIARCCRSHAQWASLECALEELLVALADKLWKGVRVPKLELRTIEAVAASLGRPLWDLFVALDSGFEAIAATANDRLARSRV